MTDVQQGHVKGMNNLAGSMLAAGRSPQEIYNNVAALYQIVMEIDKYATGEKVPPVPQDNQTSKK